jgi:hypothetical protein
MHSCVKCNFSLRYLSKLVIHFRFVHQHEHDFQLSCGVDGCSRTYKQTNSFIKHVKREHPDFHDTHFSKWKNTKRHPGALDALHEYGEQDNDSMENDVQVDHENLENNSAASSVDFKKQFALFLLHLREKSKLPSNAVVAVAKEIIDMLGYHHAEVSDNIIKYIDETLENEEQKYKIRDIFNCQTSIESACNMLNTDYNINKYVRDNFGYVTPVAYNLASERTSSKHGKYQYVPILETLQQLLKHNDVFSYVINGHQSTDNVLRNFCDGQFYKNNDFFWCRHSSFRNNVIF